MNSQFLNESLIEADNKCQKKISQRSLEKEQINISKEKEKKELISKFFPQQSSQFFTPIEIILNKKQKVKHSNDENQDQNNKKMKFHELDDPQIIVLDLDMYNNNKEKKNSINDYEKSKISQQNNKEHKQNIKKQIRREPNEKDGFLFYFWDMRSKFKKNIYSLNNEQNKENYGIFVEQKANNECKNCKLQPMALKLLICVTMYNEEAELLWKTLDGIYKNLDHFLEAHICPDNIAVCVIIDGIDKMSKDMEKFFDEEQKKEIKNNVEEKKKLSTRKNHFQKAFERKNEKERLKQKKNQKEKDLLNQIDQIKKNLQQYKNTRKEKIENANSFYNEIINSRFNNFINELEDEKYCAFNKKDEFIKKKIEYFKDDILKTFREKNDKQNFDEEFIKYPINSSYLYQARYKPKKYSQNYYLNVFYVVKLKNGGKLSSHMWFFRGFCEMLTPKYCMLIDAGTIPNDDAIFKFFRAMEADEQIGGVCGYMGLTVEDIMNPITKERKDKAFYKQYDLITKVTQGFFDIQRAQKFEYAISHMLDKSMESLFGFIQVLPGAFSAYRWKALMKQPNIAGGGDENILDSEYLVSALDPQFQNRDSYTVETANMFLAEDRILCLEIITRKNNSFLLKYLPDAQCQTDPIDSFIRLMGQRRRWINGSWFALQYVLQHYSSKIDQSNHSLARRILFRIVMMIIWVNMYIQYYSIALYFIFLNMFCIGFKNYYINFIGPEANFYVFALFFYTLAVGSLFFYSMLQKKADKKIMQFSFISTCLGIFMIASFAFYIKKAIESILGTQRLAYYVDKNQKLYVPFDTQCSFPEIVIQNYDNSQNYCKISVLLSTSIVYLIIINFASYAVPLMFYYKRVIFHILLNIFDYIYYSPSYMHTLLIFAFCNVHDMSWGTKGSNEDSQLTNIQERFQNYRISFLGKFIFMNLFFILIFSIVNSADKTQNYFLFICLCFFTSTIAIKGLTSFIYSFIYYFITRPKYEKFIQTKVNNGEYYNESKYMVEHLNKIYQSLQEEQQNFQSNMKETVQDQRKMSLNSNQSIIQNNN